MKKTINSKYGQFDVSIPRDRDASFEPQLVKKREIYLEGTEDLVLSLYTKGMSVRDIQLHLDDLYGYALSTQTISNITEKVIEKANEWQSRPLEKIYPIIFMDATVLKIRVDRIVKNIAAYIMLGISLEGKCKKRTKPATRRVCIRPVKTLDIRPPMAVMIRPLLLKKRDFIFA